MAGIFQPLNPLAYGTGFESGLNTYMGMKGVQDRQQMTALQEALGQARMNEMEQDAPSRQQLGMLQNQLLQQRIQGQELQNAGLFQALSASPGEQLSPLQQSLGALGEAMGIMEQHGEGSLQGRFAKAYADEIYKGLGGGGGGQSDYSINEVIGFNIGEDGNYIPVDSSSLQAGSIFDDPSDVVAPQIIRQGEDLWKNTETGELFKIPETAYFRAREMALAEAPGTLANAMKLLNMAPESGQYGAWEDIRGFTGSDAPHELKNLIMQLAPGYLAIQGFTSPSDSQMLNAINILTRQDGQSLKSYQKVLGTVVSEIKDALDEMTEHLTIGINLGGSSAIEAEALKRLESSGVTGIQSPDEDAILSAVDVLVGFNR